MRRLLGSDAPADADESDDEGGDEASRASTESDDVAEEESQQGGGGQGAEERSRMFEQLQRDDGEGEEKREGWVQWARRVAGS